MEVAQGGGGSRAMHVGGTSGSDGAWHGRM